MITTRCLRLLTGVVLIAFCCDAHAEAPPKKVKPPFPAKFTVVATRVLDDGRQEVDLELALEKNVEIWANPTGMTNVDDNERYAMKATVVTGDGASVPVEVTYPKPRQSVQLDDGEQLHSYTGIVKIQVRLVRPADRELKVRCRVCGGRTQDTCVGFATLETAIPAKK